MSHPLRCLIMVPNVNPEPDARGMGVGGAERMALQLCLSLDRRRIEPLLLVFRDPGESKARLRAAGVRFFVLEKRGKLPLSFWLQFRQLLRRERIDAVLSLLQGTNVHNLLVTPTVPGTGCLISFRSQHADAGLAATEGRLASRADFLIVLNESSADSLGRSYRIRRTRIVAIPNGADSAAIPPVAYASRREGRKALGLPEDAFIFYSSARIHPVKGQDLLATAFAGLDPALRAARRAVWVNTGAVQDTAVAEQIRQLTQSCAGQVMLLPHTPEPQAFMAAADCVVVPSRSESFGLTMLEAAFVGRPLVSTTVGVAPELLAAGRGILVEPDSASSLGAGLAQMLVLDESQRESQARALHEYALEHFSIEATAARYADLIETAVARRRRNGGGAAG